MSFSTLLLPSKTKPIRESAMSTKAMQRQKTFSNGHDLRTQIVYSSYPLVGGFCFLSHHMVLPLYTSSMYLTNLWRIVCMYAMTHSCIGSTSRDPPKTFLGHRALWPE